MSFFSAKLNGTTWQQLLPQVFRNRSHLNLWVHLSVALRAYPCTGPKNTFLPAGTLVGFRNASEQIEIGLQGGRDVAHLGTENSRCCWNSETAEANLLGWGAHVSVRWYILFKMSRSGRVWWDSPLIPDLEAETISTSLPHPPTNQQTKTHYSQELIINLRLCSVVFSSSLPFCSTVVEI